MRVRVRSEECSLVHVNIEVCLIHYLFSNQLLNHILQSDDSHQLGLGGEGRV